jgi:diguanylate cyclase (GGDEF)-like protein
MTGFRAMGQNYADAAMDAAFELAPTPMAICDGACGIVSRNAAWRAQESEVAAQAGSFHGWLAAAGVKTVSAHRLEEELRLGCPIQDGPELVVDLSEGRRRVWQFASTALPHGGVVLLAVDVTERKRDEEEAERMAYLDALTGLPNRRLFEDRLNQAMERLRRGHIGFAVHFIDLDRFKQVNDSLGHGAGDQLLRQVARRLATSVRRIDTVARFGGDEFGVVQTDISTADAAEALAAKLVRAVARPFRIDGDLVETGASIGVALALPGHKGEASALLDAADTALYRVKQGGRGTYRLAQMAES